MTIIRSWMRLKDEPATLAGIASAIIASGLPASALFVVVFDPDTIELQGAEAAQVA